MRKFCFVLAVLFISQLACTFGASGGRPSGQATPEEGAPSLPIPGLLPTPTAMPTPTPIPTPTAIPSKPIGIQEGLASLNSYSLVISTSTYTNTATNKSETRIETDRSKDPDASVTRQVTSKPGEEASTSETYYIGTDTCAGSEADGWEYTAYTARDKEMQQMLTRMVDLLPVIDDPVLVGAETMNDVMTNHFTFTISGFGAKSGVDVTINQGDYWLAQDGQYLVRYNLVLEARDPDTQDISHLDFLIDLTQINQPIPIAFPAGCAPKE